MPGLSATSDVLVLCYHAVSETWPAALSVTPEAFGRQVGRLLARGYQGCTFTEAVSDPPARKALAVTFDDAFLSVKDHALPILRDLGVPGTVFVPTRFPEERSGEAMSWPGIDRWV